MKALVSIERYFLAHFSSDERYYFRARILVKFILVSMLFAFGYWINTYYTGFLVARYVMISSNVVFVTLLFVFRSGVPYRWVAQLFVLSCWLIIIILTLCSGGIQSYVMPWMTLIPVMALLVLGRNSGWSWGGLGVVSILVFYSIEDSIHIPLAWMAPKSAFLTASLHIGLLAIVLSLTYLFNGQGISLLKTIRDQKRVIEEQSEEMALRNENLEGEVDKRTGELVEYNRQLEQFAFIASHNLRSPVATLLGLGHLLEVSAGNKEEVDQICRNMITTSRELDRVVRDLSTILEIRNSTQAILSEINLEEEVRLVCVNMDRELQEAGAGLVTDFTSVPVLRAVRPLVDSILMNLISNAVKYRHPDRAPRITVRSFRSDGEVGLAVSDNGMGMDLEVYGDKLFTLYGRFHTHVDGKGLGLYLVKTHVTAMGGRVVVESEPGLGTTFRVFLRDLGQI